MHRCSICQRPCACNGDTTETVTSEIPGCKCRLGINGTTRTHEEEAGLFCEHGIDFEESCAACLAEAFDATLSLAE